MSGHSKWSTIKRQKGAADVKRGATFTKISNAITIAVKQGGGVSDPTQNPRLRLAIEMARAANMPKENVERAIARANAKGEGEVQALTYEGFGPGGSSILVEAVTDNSNRTTSEIKSLFNKSGARFAEPGAVSYLFKQAGEITVNKNGKSLDEIFLSAADSGAEDIEDRGEEVVIYTDVSKLNNVKDALVSQGFDIVVAELSRHAINKIDLSPEEKEKAIEFLSSIEELDDVQKVYSNITTN